MCKIIISLVFVGTGFLLNGQANQSVSAENAMMALEELILSNDDDQISPFIDKYIWKGEKSKEEWQAHIKKVADTMRPFDGGVGIMMKGEALVLSMSNQKGQRAVETHFGSNGRIVKLILLEPEEEMNITKANIQSVFDELENEGMSGLVFLKSDGEVIINRAFGMADKKTGRKNTGETIFGTGSRPIDYTVAGIMLLDQKGLLSIDDPISKYIPDVPEDKKEMKIIHLMNGQSGLPDFFDTPDDWDPDLAWVDRETAIKRMMNQELLFPPGEGRSHSHGAFGLVAAIIEIVSGEEYYSFIRKNFLDPAGMTRTGEYGEHRGLNIEDFAIGYGDQSVGLPNIPPNWGPTSWLVKGSGGMYSTLGDLQKFYEYIRSGKVLDKEHARRFMGGSANLDGSMRGFELFSAYEPSNSEVYLFLNDKGDPGKLRQMMRALERMVLN